LGAIWPGLAFLGFGVYLAWVFLAISGTIWLSDDAINGEAIAFYAITTNFACGAVLLAGAVFQRWLARLLDKPYGAMLGGLVAMLGGIGIILGGPFFFPDFHFFDIGNALAGVGLGLLTLKCGMLYGGLSPKRVLIYALLSELVAVAVFFFVLGNETYHFIVGAPSLGGILALTLLPLVSAYLMCVRSSGEKAEVGKSAGKKAVGEPVPTAAHASGGASPASASGVGAVSVAELPLTKLVPGLWKFLLVILIFGFATSVVRGYFFSQRPPDVTSGDATAVMLMRATFALIMLVLALCWLTRLNLGKFYLAVMAAIAVAFAAAPLIKIDDWVVTVVIGFAASVFDLFVWCLLAFIVYERKLVAITVFGYGKGIYMLGAGAGWMVGMNVLPGLANSQYNLLFYLALAFGILLSTTLVFTEKDFDRLFGGVAARELDFKDILPEIAAERMSAAERQRSIQPWTQACLRVGEAVGLSAREQEVLQLLSRGRSSRNIAKQLSITTNTVRTHTQNIYLKTGVHSAEELIEMVEAEKDRVA
jgi:DNA-binding CsgD family transcriptional regulator